MFHVPGTHIRVVYHAIYENVSPLTIIMHAATWKMSQSSRQTNVSTAHFKVEVSPAGQSVLTFCAVSKVGQ